jgi:hypothetical protein
MWMISLEEEERQVLLRLVTEELNKDNSSEDDFMLEHLREQLM